MQYQPYKDIIEEKIAEWLTYLERLQEQKEKAAADIKTQLGAKLEQLKPEIDAAIAQLRDLDQHETINNTMETKNKILEIFGSIDNHLADYQEKTPFML
jgi:hypothetical protein